MKDQVQVVKDAIAKIIECSENKEHQNLVYYALSKKLFQVYGDFKISDLPFNLKNGWNRYFNAQNIQDEASFDIINKIEKVLDNTIPQNDDKIIVVTLISFVHSEKENGSKTYLSKLETIVSSIAILNLWNHIRTSEYFTIKYHPYCFFKLMLDKYFNETNQKKKEIPLELKLFWEKIDVEFNYENNGSLNEFSELLMKVTKEKSFDYILEVTSCLIANYDRYYWNLDSEKRPIIPPHKWESFVLKLRIKNVATKLWETINSTYTYSFKKEPLPVFQMLVDYYMSYHIFDEELPKKWKDTLNELKQHTHICINNTSSGIFKKIKEILDSEINQDETLLSEIVEFFVEKYSELNVNEGGEYILPKELVNFIYWYAVGTEACTTELAIYNPFAGLSAYGVEHINGLNCQLKNDIIYTDNLDEIAKCKETYRKYPWYHGVESNQTNRLIGNVRLLVKNPINLEQIYITSDDSMNDEIDSYYGGWTFIATPPIASQETSTDSLVEIMTKLVNKYIDASGMETAFFILPKTFCSDPSYYNLRQK